MEEREEEEREEEKKRRRGERFHFSSRNRLRRMKGAS